MIKAHGMTLTMQGKTDLKALDGLRGLAAIAVALFHWLLSFAGFLAVDFFLVLSGFILAHRYPYSDSPVSSGRFVLSRLARLYPMHLFGLLSYTLVYTLLLKDIPRYPDGTLFTFLRHLPRSTLEVCCSVQC